MILLYVLIFLRKHICSTLLAQRRSTWLHYSQHTLTLHDGRRRGVVTLWAFHISSQERVSPCARGASDGASDG